ncbi:MlaD family protein [Salegentibacter chungangensis]|uniref:MlaD family protein n=1 Tax=Salegentibacter chungangensis TaxID=1335724 RepID=A0ABW3NUR5_9FLAO
MKKNNSQNLKLGIFVIVGLVLFTLAVYLIGNRKNLFGNTTQISSVFKNVNGLQPGNNVRYSGVNVGTVKSISILNDTSICVDMIISEKTIGLIKKNSLATINSDGLVGSMIVNILPGEKGEPANIRPGDTITSISNIATADMLATLNTTNENAALLTADLLKITKAINDGEGVLGGLIKDKEMAIEFKNSISNLEKTTASAVQTINRINHLVSSIEYDESLASVLLSDTASADKMEMILEDLNHSASEIKLMTSNLNSFSEEIRQGDGALNYVIKDTSFVNNLESTIRNVEEASEKFNENMEALKHNFFFRGYFRRLERQKERAARKNQD